MVPAITAHTDGSDTPYSPRLRTALVLTGAGTAGAYHAGVLRALHEAGVKIDVVAGCGMGAATAMYAAIDGGVRLWEAGGLWKGHGVSALYRWRSSLRVAGWFVAGTVVVLILPLLLLAAAAIVYPMGLLLDLLSLDTTVAVATSYGRFLTVAFEPSALPSLLPRVAILGLFAALVSFFCGVVRAVWRSRGRRRERGGLWWSALGGPLSVGEAIALFSRGLWNFIRGATQIAQPSRVELSRRYSELLAENIGQPGYREILLCVHDIDARRDVVFGLLAEPYRRRFFGAPGTASDTRRTEAVDLAGVGRDHALDALGGALSVCAVTDAYLMAFAPEGGWRGETHRLCDRVGGVSRLLEEVANAGAEQVLIVSASSELGGPHALSAARRDMRGRFGEFITALDCSAVRDAVVSLRQRFKAVFRIQPLHNPFGPFDFRDCYDERSDRHPTLAELVDRGYEDAYRQFVEPIVAAGGEKVGLP